MAVPRRTLTLLRKLANQVGTTADDTVRALAASWVAGWDRLSPAWQQAIAAILDDYQRTGVWPAPWRMARIEAVARAQEATRRSLTTLLTESAQTTRTAVAEVSAATVKAEPQIIASQKAGLPRAVIPAAVIATALVARQNRVSVLHQAINTAVSGALGSLLARPPVETEPERAARELYNRARYGFDAPLIRASNVARTEPIDTYRTAAGIVHSANPQIVTGWAWTASLDRRCCLACWAMHGRTFPLTVAGPEGHGGCRCTRLVLAEGVSLPSAEARFRRLSRRDQIAILGPGRWEMWRSGQASWDSLAELRPNRGWRDSWVPRPVTDLRRLAGIR